MMVKRLYHSRVRERCGHLNGVGRILAGEPVPDPQHFHEVAAVVGPDGNRLDVNTVNEAIGPRRLNDSAEALVALRYVEVARVEPIEDALPWRSGSTPNCIAVALDKPVAPCFAIFP